MNLGKSLKKALLEQGMSQLALAAKLSITPANLNRLANGHTNMNAPMIARISKEFGMKASEFVALGED
jgi:plasmid maintenance system antidote protein VapI